MGMTNSQEPTGLDQALAALDDAQASTASAPGDDDLVAFACGELDEARAEAVRDTLARHPEAARQVLDLRDSLAGRVPEGEEAISAPELRAQWERLAQKLPATVEPKIAALPLTLTYTPRVVRRRWLAWPLAASLLVTVVGAGMVLRWWLKTPNGVPVVVEVTLRPLGRVQRGDPALPAPQVVPVGRGSTRLKLLLAGVDLHQATAFELCPHPLPVGRDCWSRLAFAGGAAPVLRLEVNNQSLPPGVNVLKLYDLETGRRAPLAEFEVQVVSAH